MTSLGSDGSFLRYSTRAFLTSLSDWKGRGILRILIRSTRCSFDVEITREPVE